MGRGLELGEGDELLPQAIEPDLPPLDQDVCLTLDQALEPLVPVEKAHHEVVDGEEGRRAEDAPRDGVVVADDRVLHGIGKREQDHQVEGIQLRQLTFAREPQADHEEGVDEQWAQHLLQHRQPEMKHVAPQLRIHGPAPPGRECS